MRGDLAAAGRHPLVPRVVLAIAIGFVGATLWLTITLADPTIRLSAQTESIQLFLGPGTLTSGIPLPRALLTEAAATPGDTPTPVLVENADVRFEDSVEVTLQRLHPDTLDIHLRSPVQGGSTGTLDHAEGTDVRRLGPNVEIRVPLREGGGVDGTFLLPFRARRVIVGEEVGFATGQRAPLLRSGEVSVSDRTIFGADFRAGERTLRTGDRFDVPAQGEAGSGFVLVDGDAGMTVSFTIRTRHAQLSADGHAERLGSEFTDRIAHDPVIAGAWVVVLFLLLQPLGTVIADRMKQRVEQFIHRP